MQSLKDTIGFIADPARAGCPKDKPRVERMIRTAKVILSRY